MAELKIMNGGWETRRELGDRLVIGRDVECDVRVDDPKISRVHCLIQREGRDWVAVDLDSHNGTLVSGWPLTRQTLKHGDVLEIGAATLQFLVAAEEAAGKQARRLALATTSVGAAAGDHSVDDDPNSTVIDLTASDPAAIPRRGPIGRRASLWEQAKPRDAGGKKKRKRKRVDPEVLLKRLHAQPAATAQIAARAPAAVRRDAGQWYHKSIPLSVGIPASIALLAAIYVLANGMPSMKFGARPPVPRSIPHSSPFNND